MVKPLKILVLTNLYPPQVIGGYERAIADFASLLKQRGHHVVVLTSDAPEIATNCPEPAFNPIVYRHLMLGGTWGEQGAEWLPTDRLASIQARNLKAVQQIVQQFQPDLCLAGNITFFGIAVLRSFLTNDIPVAHYVMNAHPGYVVEESPSDRLHRYITCSDWVRQHMHQLGYPVGTAQVVYPGAAVEQFYQATLPPRDCLRIAYASLVMPYKGADTLVEALCLLHASGVKFTATIAGGTFLPEFVQALQQLIETEGMQAFVHLPGVLSRQALSQLYKDCNILAFPSRFEEPFGISQIEAMAAGLTLVTSGTGGASEIVEHGQDGLIFEAENPFDLAECLSSLSAQPELWQRLSQAGQKKAMSQFSQTQAVEQLESVLSALVAGVATS
ncbi:MAG: glycosyltransferase family 4 protein [Stenomitos rutilans HA7619-LM2]|jgi:glycosyltransferase involved in cell wall biosynthesis|nr:glycosyltransferase family 4 protein [Stenomitos rutilans HA7619-LM2]